MKNRILLVFSLLGFLALGATFSLMQKPLPLFNQSKEVMADFPDNKDLWKQVDSLAAQGLPQSALELVNGIFNKAKTDNDMPEFLKAALYQLLLRSEFEENYIENYIGETEKNLSSTPSPARQVLHSILADLYWQYYQQNRYRILDQTVVINNNSENIASWDAKMFVDKTAEHYLTSVEEPLLLQSVSLKIYDPILETAGNSKKFRPTLFDFLAHRAIDFFSNEEAAVTRPINAFIMNDPALLSTPEQFTGLDISTNDKRSFHYNAILLLQAIEKFHLTDKDPIPLVDASLKRLEFVRNHLNYQTKDSLYLNTLTTLEEKYTNNPVSTDIIEKIASYWYSGTVQADFKRPYNEKPKPNNNFVTARNWCLKAFEKYPDTDGAKNCLVLLRSIEEPSLSFQTDLEVVPGKAFPILVNFRNQKTIFLRLLEPEYDKDASLKQEIYGERGLDKYLAMKPAKEWNITLPETNDFNQHSIEVIIPALETGYYALMISGSAAFNRSESPVTVKDFWSSNISYTSKRNEDGSGLFYLLDRSSGLPLQGVNIKSFTREYDYRSRNYIRKDNEQYTTGKDGSFTIKSYSGRDFSTLSFDFSYKNDRLVAENYFSRYRNNEPVKAEKIRTFFFTDRAIYRPGQAVYFKGIVVGTEEENNRIVADNRSTITLFDVNGQKVNTVEVISNSFGSFSGSFVLPASGLNGQFRISNNSGSAFINVEEYKRPKFEVKFQPLTGSYRLNEKVALSGKAESYSGIPISEANVSYRVVRSANFPFFRYGMRSWPGMLPESEIANGTLTTIADGSFTVNFTASPDPGDFGDLDPVYNYTVYADVTDINGETRSSLTSVQVSEKALVIGLDIPALLNRDETKNFRLTALNLNGKPTPANVTIEVFRLLDEDRLTRPRHWNAPDLALYSREEFIKQLPSDIYLIEDEKAARKDKSVYKNTFNTASDSLISMPGISKWEAGLYLVSLNATDAFGQKVSTDKEITVFSANAKRIPVKQAFWANLLTQEVKSGEKIRLLAGTASKNARIHYEVQLRGKTVFSEWIALSQEQKMLEFPVPIDFTGEVNISLNMVSDNRSYNFITSVNIPDTKHLLNIAFETFRSPLLPGGTEKWKLKVTGPDGKPLAAELLAGMYDASLDAFTKHQWFFSVYEKWFEIYNWEISRAFETGVSYSSPYDKDGD
ncbi:MAG: hypothetical protein HGA37_03900, partial [Lentimicrobium sp.]|nr:hypothetical protein [Lentimicrobium sp.]